jgi:hypothetical protein
MIANADRTVLVSSMGWVDHDSLWVLDVPAARETRVSLGSGARYLSLHASTSSAHFAVAHHFDGPRLELTVHRFTDPARVRARATVREGVQELVGDAEEWQQVPRLYVGYLSLAPWKDYVLLSVSPSSARIEVQRLGWFDATYDKDYQGIVEVLEIPGQGLALISVARSSTLVMHELSTGQRVGTIELAGRAGNPKLHLRAAVSEVWASDYDSLVVVDPRTWRVVRSRQIQAAKGGTQQFIGDYAFSPQEASCLVARPFSGDVVELDPSSLKITRVAGLGRQPLELAALAEGQVCARDWQTGDMLRGRLERRGWLGRPW